MTRPTSLQAFRELALPEAQAAVLAALEKHGPAITAAELEQASGLRHCNKRTSELVRAGLAHEAGRRPCQVSGRNAITWSAGHGDGVRRREVPSIAQGRRCSDHTADLSARIAAVGSGQV